MSEQLTAGDVRGVIVFGPELRESITPRELDLIKQAFAAGIRFGSSPPAPLDPPAPSA